MKEKIMKCPKCKSLNFKKVGKDIVKGNPDFKYTNWYICECGKEWHNHTMN